MLSLQHLQYYSCFQFECLQKQHEDETFSVDKAKQHTKVLVFWIPATYVVFSIQAVIKTSYYAIFP